MTQGTRNIIANVLLTLGVLTIVVFVVTHFMASPRPAWRTDMVWIGIALVIISRAVRGRRPRTI